METLISPIAPRKRPHSSTQTTRPAGQSGQPEKKTSKNQGLWWWWWRQVCNPKLTRNETALLFYASARNWQCVFLFCVTDSKQVRCSLFDCWFGFESQQFFVCSFSLLICSFIYLYFFVITFVVEILHLKINYCFFFCNCYFTNHGFQTFSSPRLRKRVCVSGCVFCVCTNFETSNKCIQIDSIKYTECKTKSNRSLAFR